MIDFHNTMMGRQFFDGIMPRLVKALEKIAEGMPIITHMEQRTEPMPVDEQIIKFGGEPRRVTFQFGASPFQEIHVMTRDDGGEKLLEIEGGGSIEVHPRAGNMIHVKLRKK